MSSGTSPQNSWRLGELASPIWRHGRPRLPLEQRAVQGVALPPPRPSSRAFSDPPISSRRPPFGPVSGYSHTCTGCGDILGSASPSRWRGTRPKPSALPSGCPCKAMVAFRLCLLAAGPRSERNSRAGESRARAVPGSQREGQGPLGRAPFGTSGLSRTWRFVGLYLLSPCVGGGREGEVREASRRDGASADKAQAGASRRRRTDGPRASQPGRNEARASPRGEGGTAGAGTAGADL